MNELLITANELAELVGFDFAHRAWLAEPEELEQMIPGISLVLYRLFNAVHTAANTD